MRILIWEQIRKELDASAAFNMTLMRAIDPRLISHRPRDPEKARLMSELGMETRSEVIARKTGTKSKKKISRKSIAPTPISYEIITEIEPDQPDS